ncbi:MAG: PD-(D/E)XK nuclease family protein [Terriglobales bacterium]
MQAAPVLTLCSHPRLAYGLGAAYDQAQLAAGNKSWESPPIFTLDTWLQQLWSGCGDCLLLTADQEQLLWRAIISDAVGSTPLLDLSATAASAAEAWRLAHAWNWEWRLRPADASDETAAFQQWATELRHQCERGPWITAAQLPVAVTAMLRRGAVPAPPLITLAGFDDSPIPAILALFDALAAAGARLDPRQSTWTPALAQLASAADVTAECELAARWARQLLEQGSAGPIGVIIPDLARRRAEVARIFAQTLHADLPPWDPAPRAFHLSLGPALAEAPIVAAALQFLETLLLPEPIELQPLLTFLRSPFLAAAGCEAAGRARLENALRNAQHPAWLWSGVDHFAGQHAPRLAAVLRAARAAVRAWPRQQSHQAWIESFSATWEALGWPSERSLDSSAWQTRHAWERLLDEFGRLDQIAPAALSAADALARLRACTATRAFQPQTGPTPVQVLGWLEATGLEFSNLWVCGMDDESLPGPPRPNPFLPLAWQCERQLPHSTAAVELASAQRQWQRLLRSSPFVIASCSRRAADGHDLRPSPLLAGCKRWESALPDLPQSQPAELEFLPDAQGPPTFEPERHGSSGLLKDQSACPFRAFAHRRLHAQAPSALQPGLAPSTRGALLHAVLARLLQPGRKLPLHCDDALRRFIAELAAAVVAEEHALQGLPGLAAIEQQRLADTVVAWCEIVEQHRPESRILAAEEKLDPVHVAGLTLDLRRDRVDQLAAGGRLLLDYKSGALPAHAWEGDRPKEPQLPLYWLADPDPASVAAVAFAHVRSGQMKLEPCDGRPPDAAWGPRLEALAQEYVAGYAAVQPRDEQACNFCDLPALCRIREHA